jgi:hypothetical protein
MGGARRVCAWQPPRSSSCSKAQCDATDGTYETHATYVTGRCHSRLRSENILGFGNKRSRGSDFASYRNTMHPSEHSVGQAAIPPNSTEFDARMICVRAQSSFGNYALANLEALLRVTGFGLHLAARLNPANVGRRQSGCERHRSLS